MVMNMGHLRFRDFRTNGRMNKRVCAGLKQCIDAHGPIDRAHIGSAAKRILRELREELREGNGNG